VNHSYKQNQAEQEEQWEQEVKSGVYSAKRDGTAVEQSRNSRVQTSKRNSLLFAQHLNSVLLPVGSRSTATAAGSSNRTLRSAGTETGPGFCHGESNIVARLRMPSGDLRQIQQIHFLDTTG
jgi:hypothetical protein